MLALACAVIDHAALVCLVQDRALDEGSVKGELAEEDLVRHATVLEQHGLSIAATVPEGEMMSWARAQGPSAFAVVCADARIPHMSAAVGTMAGRSKVDARSTAACGAALFVSSGESCGVGGELLAIPLATCVRPCDADMSHVRLPPPLAALREEEPANWAAMCVRVALVQAVQRGADDARAQYWTRVCPPSHFAASHMACWAQDSPAARHAQHSISYRRACAWREGVERQRRALASAGLAVSSELFLWAALVVQSRAVLVDGMGPVLCPGVDCANHVSVLPSACVLVEGDLVRLLATGRLEGGMEVTLCYDAEADYLDVFERWGFFDTSSTVHTAEVVVPAAALTPGAGDCGHEDQDWRRQLVEAQAEIGCNATFDSWWVPDVALEVCPLLCAVRALFVTEEELLALDEEVCIDDVLTSEIAREDEVRRMLATLFREHLAGYGEEGEDHGGGRQGAGCGQEMEAALKLVSFEKRLLRDQLEVLLRSVAVAA
jgi:histone arginine demethylase JMJD6